MYITKYWGNFIGGTDDSLTLAELLAEMKKEEISVSEILAAFEMDKLNGDFRDPGICIERTDAAGWQVLIYYAIDLISDLAALMLECKMSGYVDLQEIDSDLEEGGRVRITASEEDNALINRTLADFAENPTAYDLKEMMAPEDVQPLANLCGQIREGLYG